MPRAREITPEVREVLEESLIDGNTLYLPPKQLDRKLYEAVNKALTDLGGKWDRKAKGHVFPRSPKEALAEALDTGATVNEQQAPQAFFTPPELADMVVAHADVGGKAVLEPSAGEGALAEACVRAHAMSVLCVEKHQPFIEVLQRKLFTVRPGDFLETPVIPAFDRVVMNPPFTNDQDIKHVMHALKFLRPGGRLVSVMAGNTTRRRFANMLSELVRANVYAEVHQLPEGAFKAAGTGVRTVLLVVNT